MSAAPAIPAPRPPIPMRRRPKVLGRVAGIVVALAALALLGWYGVREYQALAPAPASTIPTALVERGDVAIEVHAQGTLKGGHSQMLVAPPVAGGTLSIKFLLAPGTPVKPGETVVEFDTATQQYNLTQAQEALEQAQQQVVNAQATAAATNFDDAYNLAKAQFDVKRAQLQVQKNPTIDAIDAKKNDLTLAAAEAHVAQLQQDIASRAASNTASIAVQQAAVKKAQADAATAEHNIASMALKAAQAGYVSVRTNTSTSIVYAGMSLPSYQVGDTVRPGQAVVEIPDTSTWEVDLDVSELDAGHLTPGLPVAIQFVSLPGQVFQGTIQSIGAASGPPWQRTVAVVAAVTHPTAALRPGIAANAVITTAQIKNALWVPSPAVFDIGGRSYVFLQAHGQFNRHLVTVVQRSESQVVVQGVSQGDAIALSNPEAQPSAGAAKPTAGRGSAASAIAGGRG